MSSSPPRNEKERQTGVGKPAVALTIRRQRAEALAERSVEIAQAMVPLAGALARGGG